MGAYLFDAVLFDLDGTLVATDRFWLPAARAGARRAFAALGLERALPDAAGWMSVVGKPLDEGFRDLFPDLDPEERRAVQEACQAEEHRLLRAGDAVLFPGARDVLAHLREAGLALGIASNCTRAYLEHMLGALGLGALVDAALCLDSPGVTSKADMLGALLRRFETRSAVMVGDRLGDRDAAWANGIPHVHCAFGFAAPREEVDAEAAIEELVELPGVVRRRGEWIAEALRAAGGRRRADAPLAIGVTGPPLAGKSLFARDLARVLAGRRGTPAHAVSLARFERTDAGAGPFPDPLGRRYDLDRLRERVLEPHAAGREVRLDDDPPLRMRPGEALVLEGPFLADPRLAPRLERILRLELPLDLALRRAAALGDGALAELRGVRLPEERAFAARYPAPGTVDVVLDASNPLGPPLAPRDGARARAQAQ